MSQRFIDDIMVVIDKHLEGQLEGLPTKSCKKCVNSKYWDRIIAFMQLEANAYIEQKGLMLKKFFTELDEKEEAVFEEVTAEAASKSKKK